MATRPDIRYWARFDREVLEYKPFFGEWIGFDVKAMRTQKAKSGAKHLAASKELFCHLLEKAVTLDREREAQLIKARDYQELDRYILCHLLGKKPD